jgi:hypothetical protein
LEVVHSLLKKSPAGFDLERGMALASQVGFVAQEVS